MLGISLEELDPNMIHGLIDRQHGEPMQETARRLASILESQGAAGEHLGAAVDDQVYRPAFCLQKKNHT